MSTVHQFPVQRNQPPAAPEEVADALGVAIDAAVGAGRQLRGAVKRRPWHSRMRPRDSSWSANCWRSRTVTAPTWKLTVSSTSGTSRGSCGISRCAGRSTSSGGPTREMGVRNGPTLVPLDLDAGLVERTTPALGFRIALGYAKDHMRSCAEDMTADHRCPPSRSTLERVAKAIGTAATRVAPRIEPRLRRAERVPDGAVAISLGLDRTSVPMEEDVPAGETPATRRKTRHTPYTRKKPAPVNVNYRMAYVGTISFHDADGTALATRRCSARVPYGPSRATDDGRSSPCAPAGARPGRRGHPETARPSCGISCARPSWPNRWSRPATKRSTGIISPSGSPTSYGTGSPTRPLAGRGCLGGTRASTALTTAIYRIRAWVRDRYADALARSDRRLLKQLAPHLTYLENNADLMHYARLRAVGLPVGSGVTEGGV